MEPLQIPGPNRMLHYHVEELVQTDTGREMILVPYPAIVIRCNESAQTVDVFVIDDEGSNVLRGVDIVARSEAKPGTCTWPKQEGQRFFPRR